MRAAVQHGARERARRSPSRRGRGVGALFGRELLDGVTNPTPVLIRRGGPLRAPAGGKFEFEPTEG